MNTDRKDSRVNTIGRNRPAGPCPTGCADAQTGPHIHQIGTSEFRDEVLVKVDPNGSGPLVDVIRQEDPNLTGLTAEQTLAVAGLLSDGNHADGRLVSLLFDAHDLITRPQPRFGVLRAIFRTGRRAEKATA